jgi:hypothetical protein
MITRTLTAEHLIVAGVKSHVAKRFRADYPNGMRIGTTSAARRWQAVLSADMEVIWFVENVLSPDARAAWEAKDAEAQAAYKKATESARAAYEAGCAASPYGGDHVWINLAETWPHRKRLEHALAFHLIEALYALIPHPKV